MSHEIVHGAHPWILGLCHSSRISLAFWHVMLVMAGAPGGSVSVVTTRASEAGPSRFLVNARTAMWYLVKEAEKGADGSFIN